MKIEINLSEIIDEEGECIIPEFEELVLQGVIKNVTNMINKKINDAITEHVKVATPKILESMIPEILDHEFQETGSYGYKKDKEPTTIRNKILKDMEKAMVWKDGSYDSDKSPYTRVIKNVVGQKLNEFAKEFNKEVDTRFIAEALEYATERLRKRAGIK